MDWPLSAPDCGCDAPGARASATVTSPWDGLKSQAKSTFSCLRWLSAGTFYHSNRNETGLAPSFHIGGNGNGVLQRQEARFQNRVLSAGQADWQSVSVTTLTQDPSAHHLRLAVGVTAPVRTLP